MNADSSLTAPSLTEIEQQAHIYFSGGNYKAASQHYEQMLVDDPAQASYYWHLGLALVLQGQEAEAQFTWMTPILEAESEVQQEQLTLELINVLSVEADRQETLSNYETAWLLRQHLREFAPNNTDNLLRTLGLALQAKIFSFEDSLLPEIIHCLQTVSSAAALCPDRLLQVSQLLLQLNPGHAATLNFLESCIPYLSGKQLTEWIDWVLAAATRHSQNSQFTIASKLNYLAIPLVLDNIKILLNIIYQLQGGSIVDRLESIKLAERCLELATNPSEKISATNALLSSWLYSGGDWKQAVEIYQTYKALLQALIKSYAQMPNAIGEVVDVEQKLGFLSNLAPVGSLFFYFEDEPKTNRPLRNQIAQIAQSHLRTVLSDEVSKYQSRSPLLLTASDRKRLPRIGYFAGTLRQHSVGWLSRWLLTYHNRDRFDIHLYSPRPSQDPIQQQFRQEYGDRFHDVSSNIADIANQIYDDQIDILVEMDSLTNFGGCGVVALKPAPIQVHWLGYDASGIPGVDYFIVDPYVVPEDAQSYYSETLWRLPHTYIAVDGFETHTPSLRRDQLGIPGDAIIYLSSQTGLKRNIDNVRLQMQVIKAVPNSYFLIKSFLANPEFIKTFFQDVAESEGVSADRLRFLPDVSSEFVHRANLAIADVVLDTYPYNGATTTLEALWTGLPIVTRVGEQFAARNSYTMMMNAGITEGISWNDDEYLEWGIKLGQDAALRQDIFYRLKRSRHTSPLWNGRQFAQDMESAYEQMWERL
ncbi:MAG: tetratricopeptide repeat protein [Drouetiella hepatica Uher 2000/2452]|jgi:predicted O-linked N-acetylglucosamine transferase (SPINDLY family)|uniref:Tetratricopeptide repeat protein n=1 Tax=Drouetiella hepatica Uher 2000/2452 TaxID=904376 RepID=A0A951QF39_9CYAN|nr:tetratricopeptide repeat protein [Drouetiella hepatica Uher 2000/2452]